jgi:hypothetical protein
MNAKRTDPENGVRPGVLLAISGLAIFLGVVGWLFRPGSRTTAQSEPPSIPAPQATVVATHPLSPVTRATPTAGRTDARQPKVSVPPPAPRSLEDRWGIQVSSLRLSMANSIVDLRYRVIDPGKAARLADGKTAAYLLDQTTGRKLAMPSPPKEGAFPPTANQLVAGKTYFAMVSNQGGALKSGSKVAVVVGESRVGDLVVE